MDHSEKILKEINTVPRTVQQAKVYGVDFSSILSRGSQFMVESILMKVAKQNNYLLLSATKL